METYFNINYEFDKNRVFEAIDRSLITSGSDYICVADGVILSHAHTNEEYNNIINSGMFAICDSSYVPLYVKLLYGRIRKQYSGSEIFEDIVRQNKYRMVFMGTSKNILDGLKKELIRWNAAVKDMSFVELPFCSVEKFDYPSIARFIEEDKAQIIWVALGAPKQEEFMYRLKPHLNHGVMIAVGAAFKFFSGIEASRAPKWMINNHLEFVYRLFKEPKKQYGRCKHIVVTLPNILYKEYKRKKDTANQV